MFFVIAAVATGSFIMSHALSIAATVFLVCAFSDHNCLAARSDACQSGTLLCVTKESCKASKMEGVRFPRLPGQISDYIFQQSP